MKLTHIGISHFRSIGEAPVIIDLSKRITVLVGQNDCGKSNVLRGMEIVSAIAKANAPHTWTREDSHNLGNEPPRMHYKAANLESLASEPENQFKISGWNRFARSATKNSRPYDAGECEQLEGKSYQQNEKIFQAIGVLSAYSQRAEADNELAKQQASIHFATQIFGQIPTFRIIPQYRRIDDKTDYHVSGAGVIRRLAEWQNPGREVRYLKEKFSRVQKFLCDLLQREGLELDVPRSEKEILVTEQGRSLPLESHGTGIHQLIILAIAVLSEEDVIFGIEEPEVHLHPVLQRRFLNFLLTETENRYVITTHSASLIAPSEEVDVIHLKRINGATVPFPVKTDRGTLEALDDLGFRASDLLQANAVIWVEGPSDRIYLKHWLKALAPELVEGIDYSLMFYGGRLLSHLTVEVADSQSNVDSLIPLLRINQYSAVMMDRDTGPNDEKLSSSKKRVIAECEANQLFHWVTDGKEIENYLPAAAVTQALRERYPEHVVAEVKILPFTPIDTAIDNAFGGPKQSPFTYSNDKVGWARRFVACMSPNPSTWDPKLVEKMKELVAFLKPGRHNVAQEAVKSHPAS